MNQPNIEQRIEGEVRASVWPIVTRALRSAHSHVDNLKIIMKDGVIQKNTLQ